MKLSKVALAVAGLAIASGSAFAGQIDSSSATLAREVIVNNAQTIRAPSKSYQFDGAVDARTNEQRLQLQWTLTGGLTWSSAGDYNLAGSNGTVPLPLTQTVLQVSGIDGANVPVTAFPAGTTVTAFTANAGTTLVFNVTIPSGAGAAGFLINNANFRINANNFLTAGVISNVGVTNAFAVAGATACVAPDTFSNINFKHFTNHLGNNTVQTGTQTTNPDSEHFRTNATNDGRIINFTENLNFVFTPAANTSRTDAAFLNSQLTPGNGVVNFAGTPAPVLALANVLRHYIGRVNLNLRGNGLDLDYTRNYGNADNVAGFLPVDFNALVEDVGSLNTGDIELASYVHSLTIPAAWPVGTTVTGYDAAGAVILATAPSIAGQTVFNLSSVNSAAQAASLAQGVYLIAQFPGGLTNLIPQTGGIVTVASLNKDTLPGAPDYREQNNVCTGTLTGIGGGIKIDIRNYASTTKFPTGNYSTVARLINNSESQAADVFAQMIYADGKYGPWGAMPSLAPRAVANYTSAQLEAFLVNAAPVVSPFAASTKYTSDQTARPTYVAPQVVGASANTGTGDRIRFVSNTGTTIRVQSYLVFPGGVLDVTNAQGVDFENSGDRVPVTAVDAQPVSQDAINGLAK
jgi:hypothetical protein